MSCDAPPGGASQSQSDGFWVGPAAGSDALDPLAALPCVSGLQACARDTADQVCAGKSLARPQRVGLFRVVESRVEPISGYPGLLTKTGHRSTGFVRIFRGAARNTDGPIVGVKFDLYLGGGWWYHG